MNLVWLILLSIVCAILYRMGGAAGYPKTWRRFGCPVIVLLACFIIGIKAPWWAYLISYGLSYGSMTTYFEVDSNDDTDWYEWILTGFVTSLAIAPLLIGSDLWVAFWWRTGIMTALTFIWSQLIGDAVQEELGRGFLLVATLSVFLF